MIPSLQLSQSALAAFDRCARRFYLRFVRRLEWPAPLTGSEQEWERSLRRGEALHLFIQQAALGLDVDPLVRAAGDADLARWWDHVVRQPPPQPDGEVHTEVELRLAVGRHRLVARFDRLVVAAAPSGPRLHIIDWKTGRPQPAARLAASWQADVYRFVAVEAGARLTPGGAAVAPADVTFTYWQADAPEAPVELAYGAGEHEAARQRVETALERIDTRLGGGEADFERTADLDACRHCPYRSYCERGRETPPGIDLDEDFDDGSFLDAAGLASGTAAVEP